MVVNRSDQSARIAAACGTRTCCAIRSTATAIVSERSVSARGHAGAPIPGVDHRNERDRAPARSSGPTTTARDEDHQDQRPELERIQRRSERRMRRRREQRGRRDHQPEIVDRAQRRCDSSRSSDPVSVRASHASHRLVPRSSVPADTSGRRPRPRRTDRRGEPDHRRPRSSPPTATGCARVDEPGT